MIENVPFFSFTAKDTNGRLVPMEDFRNQVVLVTNTASKCGFTSQYEDLERLYKKYHDAGFTILAFPCNQFGQQEPGDDASIAEFCRTRFNISFPLFSKIEVNGSQAHPLFSYLKGKLPGVAGTQMIKWNFTKFLIDKKGRPRKRYAPRTSPKDIIADIETCLAET